MQTPRQADKTAADAQLNQAREQLADLSLPKRPTVIAAYEAQVEQIRASTQLAQIDMERQEGLLKENATSENQYDHARFTYARNRAQLAQAQAQLATVQLPARTNQILAAAAGMAAAEGRVRKSAWYLEQTRGAAPTSGLVFDTLYREGEYVAPGHPVVALLPPENIKVRLFVPQPYMASITMGQTIRFTSDTHPEGMEATVNYISPEPEYTPPVIFSQHTNPKLVFMVEAVMAPDIAQTLHPGQPVQIHL